MSLASISRGQSSDLPKISGLGSMQHNRVSPPSFDLLLLDPQPCRPRCVKATSHPTPVIPLFLDTIPSMTDKPPGNSALQLQPIGDPRSNLRRATCIPSKHGTCRLASVTSYTLLQGAPCIPPSMERQQIASRRAVIRAHLWMASSSGCRVPQQPPAFFSKTSSGVVQSNAWHRQ